MTCEEIRARLSEYLDGECDERDEVARHLESCAECKREFEKLVTLSKSFEGFVKAPDRSVADSVVSVIRQEKMKKTPFFVRHIGLAASLVLILILALYTRFFPYNTKEESAEIGDVSGKTVTLEAEILDIKNSATLKDDVHFAVSEDMSQREEASAEETVTKELQMSEAVAGTMNEAPLSPSPEYVLTTDTLKPIDILSCEFEVEQVDENTLHIKTDNLERVKELVGDNYNAYLENGIVVVLLK